MVSGDAPPSPGDTKLPRLLFRGFRSAMVGIVPLSISGVEGLPLAMYGVHPMYSPHSQRSPSPMASSKSLGFLPPMPMAPSDKAPSLPERRPLVLSSWSQLNSGQDCLTDIASWSLTHILPVAPPISAGLYFSRCRCYCGCLLPATPHIQDQCRTRPLLSSHYRQDGNWISPSQRQQLGQMVSSRARWRRV